MKEEPKPEVKKEEEEKVPPPVPPAVPSLPGVEAPYLQAPAPSTPSPAPALGNRFQRRLDLIQPGRLLFNLAVEGEYDDNAFNTSGIREADFRIVIVPAVAIDRTAGKTSLNLRYTPRILQYTKFTELNRVDHALRFAASWDPSPWLQVSLRDALAITSNPAEEGSSLGIARTGIRRTLRNEFSPGLDFRLTPRSDLAVGYTNTIIDEERSEDRTVNGGRIFWAYRLSRGGISLGYDLAFVDREVTPNTTNHRGTLRYSRDLTPRSQLQLTGSGSFSDEEVGEDQTILSGSVGLDHRFNPRLRVNLVGGIQGFEVGGDGSSPRFFTNSDLEWTFPRGSLTLGVVQRFENTFATVDDQGAVLNSSFSGSLSYQPAPRLTLSGRGSFSRVERQDDDTVDLIGRMGIDLRYQLGIFAVTAGYNFFNRDSDRVANDLRTNRIFFGVSVGYSTPLPF